MRAMQSTKSLFGLCAALFLAAACGGEDTGDQGSAGAGQTPSGLNGCEEASAVDMTAASEVAIAFGGDLGNAYEPACVRIKSGTAVTWTGSFATHPMRPGTVDPATGQTTPDTSSPIEATTEGDSATFTFPSAGEFPYFCVPHASVGMYGAVFVE